MQPSEIAMAPTPWRRPWLSPLIRMPPNGIAHRHGPAQQPWPACPKPYGASQAAAEAYR